MTAWPVVNVREQGSNREQLRDISADNVALFASDISESCSLLLPCSLYQSVNYNK